MVTAWTWKRFATLRVLAPDQRGFGQSDRASRYSFDLMGPASLAELRGLEKLDLRWNKFADLPAPAQRLRRGGCVVLI